MARPMYDVPSADGWTHIGGPTFQALIRMPRAHPIVKVVGALADQAPMDVVLATVEAAGRELPHLAAYAAVEFTPHCRAVVLGPACAVLSGPGAEERLQPVDGEKIDVVVEWEVTRARLEPADASPVTEVPGSARPPETSEVPDEQALDREPDDDSSSLLSDPSEETPQALPSDLVSQVPWSPPPPAAPDAWWLQELGIVTETVGGVEEAPPDSKPSTDEGAPAPVAPAGLPARERPSAGQHTPAARGSSRWFTPVGESPGPAPSPRPRSTTEAPAYLLLSMGATVPVGRRTVLGRAPSRAAVDGGVEHIVQISPKDPMVSRSHAVVEVMDDDVVITDLGSKNGTSVFTPGAPGIALDSGSSTRVALTSRGVVMILGSTASVWIYPGSAPPPGEQA